MADQHPYKQIGVLGGLSYESTADLYQLLMQKHAERFNDSFYPEVTIQSVNFGKVIELQDAEKLDVPTYVGELSKGLRALSRAGAEFIVIAANTPHIVFDELQETVDVPMRSIVAATRDYASARQLASPLLLGTRRTMSSDFYPQSFSEKGIEIVVPDANDQEVVDAIIFSDLVQGETNADAKQKLLQVIGKYPVDSVILGCTELPMLISAEDVDIEALDTLDIQAEDVLDFALS